LPSPHGELYNKRKQNNLPIGRYVMDELIKDSKTLLNDWHQQNPHELTSDS
jgi:hypothetical protein